MFAVIYIHGFGLQAVLRREPELASQAVALVEGDAAKGNVVQVSDAARTLGVIEGLTAPQAMARCRDLIFKPRSVDAENAATATLLQTASAFSPHIEDTAPGICSIDMKGLGLDEDAELRCGDTETQKKKAAEQGTFGFLEAVPVVRSAAMTVDSPAMEWGRNILNALETVGLRGQVGIASTPGFALLAARAARPVLVVARGEDFVSGLPLESLDPRPDLLDLLHRWGIRRVGEFVALGKEAIAERLDLEALELFDRASGETVRPLNIVVPCDTFEEGMEFEAHIETLEPLLFVLRRFVEQLALRVGLTYRVVAELQLELNTESGARHERTFRVPSPTSHVETLFRMLHTHLETVRTESAITALTLRAIPSRAENRQFGLFETALRDPNHFHETLARLTALLGPDRVGSPVVEPSHRADAFQMRVPQFEAASAVATGASARTGKPVGLALRRFRPPPRAEVTVENGTPKFVTTLRMSGTVRRARGPWIASGDWWDQRRWSRHEWDVELREGSIYRLFSSEGEWFVEGVYD